MKAQILFKTTRSLVLELLDEKADYFTEEYVITIDGREYSSNKTIFSIAGLKPDTEYGIEVKRGEEVFTMTAKTDYEFVTLNVKDFGAAGDGVNDDTPFIQAAILTAPKNGRVYVPAGVYCITHLFLKSDIVLEVGKDATILGVPDKKRTPILPGRIESYDETGEYLPASWEGNPLDCYASIITGMNCENVVICGEGTIDGGADFDNWWNTEKRRNDPAARPRMMFLNNCSNVTVQGVTIKNSPSWNMHPYFSKNIRFIDITLQSPSNSHNTDGIDPESCTGVEIVGVHFSVGDDCIAIKSGKIYMGKTYKTPSKDITVRNCFMEKGHGAVTIGSEIGAGVENIVVKNCYFLETDRGLRVKTRRGRGKDSFLNGITFENVRMKSVRSAFVINGFYYCGADGKSEYVATKEALPVDDRTPRVGAIKIKNVECKDTHVAGVYFYGIPESKIQCVELENVYIDFAEDARPGKAAMMNGCEAGRKQGVFIRNADKVTLKNVVIEGYEGEPTNIEEVGEWSWN